jgi:hypothetical protein
MSIELPAEFAELQPFVGEWAGATEYARASQRRRSSPAELKAFYDVALKHLPAILERCDRQPLGALTGVDRELFRLALSLAEIAPHVELYGGDPRVPFAFREERLFGSHCGVED